MLSTSSAMVETSLLPFPLKLNATKIECQNSAGWNWMLPLARFPNKSTWVNQKSRRLAVPRCPRKHAIPNAVRPHSAVASMVSKDNSFNNVMTWRFLQGISGLGSRVMCLLHWFPRIYFCCVCFGCWLVAGEQKRGLFVKNLPTRPISGIMA